MVLSNLFCINPCPNCTDFDRLMKRRDLLRYLSQQGCQLVREEKSLLCFGNDYRSGEVIL
ncbi:hypothetical protein IQ242_21610 [Microcystis sp. LEGE 08355]|nr:hypothetical protein [Microcystis sp. LEGE 08355]